MPAVDVGLEYLNGRHDSGSVREVPISLAAALWAPVQAGGAGPINVVAGFTNPSSLQADRIPEVTLTVAAAPGNHVLTGLWNGEARSITIAALAGQTVKADLPLDTITSWTGPDPGGGESATLNQGDSFSSPPARAVSVAVAGDVACQLEAETAVKVATAPAGDWQRRATRVEHAGPGRTTATGLAFLY